MSESVVRLVDRVKGVAVSDQADLMDWLQAWTDGLKEGEYGEFRSIVLVLETKDGQLATIAQSLGALDTARLIGLLIKCAHHKTDGSAEIADLRQ